MDQTDAPPPEAAPKRKRGFTKGISGNPGGRPKGYREVEAIARDHTELAMNTLAEICKNKKQPAGARVSAASTLLDRGWGRAPQNVTVDGTVNVRELDDTGLDQVIRDELAAFLIGGAQRAAEAEGESKPH